MNKTAGIFRRIFKHTPVIRFISCIILLMSGLSSQGQTTYPVQVFTQLTPPYTSYLPAYYSGINQKLKVTLINTDMRQPLLNVYLRMSVKSSAFTIETPENIYTQRIELQAGVPLQLSLNDLAVYFKNENMRVSGGRNEFLRTNMLPDNFYRFNFEVYEANTGRLLSNPKMGFAQAMIASGEPPVLNLPLKGTTIMESNIPSIMFSWTPRHMNSVASAYGTEYEFTLVEIYDKQVSPEAAFGFSRVLYTETVRSTSFIHTVAQPQLIPGMRYAWQVRAVAREGVEEANVFKNNGFSPVSWFDYTVDCKPVQFDKVEVKDRVAVISWQQSDAAGYDVQYRKRGSNRWYTGTLKDNETCPVYNLKFGEEYEYRIGVRCTMNDAFTYSRPKGFNMPEELAKSANCGILPDINVSNRTPARELQARLPILVGDFPVFITKVSGSGRFTGEGYVGIPYMKNAKIAVTFKDIVVNTDNRMIGGFIETKYDISSSGKNLLWDVDETLTGGKGVGDIRTGEEKAQYIVDYTIDSKLTQVPVKKDTSEDKIKDGEASETTSGENERYVVTLTDDKGNKQEQVVDKFPATIEDKSGAVYEVDKEGNIKQVSSKSDIRLDDNTKYKQDTTVVSVRFEETDNTRYALDVYTGTYNKVTEYEREYIVSETEPIRTSAKLMLPDTSDEIFVRAIANDKGFDPAKVHFVTESRTEYKAEYNSQKGGWTLNLVAPPANDGQLVYAVYDKGNGQYGTLAILKVLTYEPKEVNVMLVPVNGVAGTINEGALQEEVNAIYNKFGVTVNLKVSKERFDYMPIDGAFQIDGTGLFDTRTADMDALEAAFRKTGKYNDQTVYLFVMDKPSNIPDVKGDMPRDSRMGYLFPSYDVRTIAHEIGHGVFNLKHPFAKGILTNQFNKGELKDNLMDYPAGTGLAKLQWDALHSPGIVIGLFEKDGDAMSIQTNAIPREFADNGYLNFLTPTGKKITLPENCVATFKYGITTSSSELRSTIGYLESFKIIQDGEVMEYTCSIVNNNFTGYYDTKTKATYLDEYTDQNTQSNAVTVVLTTTGLRFVKVNVSDLKPYKINEPVVEYDLFPVLPYKTGNIIKTSEETSYSDIKNLTASRGEDWSLNREYLSSMLKGHENKPEYGYVVKIVELRTAYRGLFDSFTVYFDKWNEIKTEETILNRQTGYYDVVRYNLSQWDKLYVTDTSLQSLWRSDPAGYYKQFVNAFIDYIESAANTKQDFLSTLSLSTRPKEASDFLSLCSNDELSDIPWEKREILLRVLASESIVGNALEKNIIRLVKYIPQADISSLLNALKTQKDAKGKDQLLYCFMGKTINDLNGEEFYSFAGIIHSYLNEQYQYDRSPSAIGLNKRENRYFSFDPSFWTSKPIVIEMNGDGSIRFTLRKQFTVMQYDPVILQDPYASVTLHFEDDKTSGEFGFKKNQVYTTSGLMAYAICYSILKDNAKIGGFVVLNTALMATGIGELNAALQAGRTGAAVLAGTDIALGIGYIVVDTGYRDRWQQTEDGRTVLKFWDGVNLLYAGGRITQALYNSAQAAKTSANTLRNSADDAERAILEETEQQADDVIARFNVENFVGKNVNQQYAEIANVWKSKYPIEEMLEGRTFFERLMGEYRYTKTAGWGHTADIAHNFKGVDFYKGFTEIGDRIFSETAVSMKTTITKSVDDWLKINKGNIDVLTQSMGNGANNGIKWNGKTLFYNKAELHIYVPKENLTPEFKSEWINKLSNYNSNVTYQINAIEDFIK